MHYTFSECITTSKCFYCGKRVKEEDIVYKHPEDKDRIEQGLNYRRLPSFSLIQTYCSSLCASQEKEGKSDESCEVS